LSEIKEFLKVSKQHAEYALLEDVQRLLDVSFLTDLTYVLIELNVELQRKGHDQLCEHFNANHNCSQEICNVRTCISFNTCIQNLNTRARIQHSFRVQNILSEFCSRFTDFASLEPIATYMCFPFGTDINVEVIASKMGSLVQLDTTIAETEILTHQNDIQLKSRATTEMKEEFWELLLEEKYPNIRRCALNISVLFGSTFLCESAFSHMKIIKSKYRSTMTDGLHETCGLCETCNKLLQP
jgi:hypothetical protein